jgi:DNA-binding NtrC family response regulator
MGIVRELENVIERAVVLTSHEVIEEDLPQGAPRVAGRRRGRRGAEPCPPGPLQATTLKPKQEPISA